MNCCDEYGNCRQGRDCPARVAKVKRQLPKYPAPPRQQSSRGHTKHLTKWMLITIAVMYLVAIIAGVTHA